jgi:predicted metal-dependent hydrolase
MLLKPVKCKIKFNSQIKEICFIHIKMETKRHSVRTKNKQIIVVSNMSIPNETIGKFLTKNDRWMEQGWTGINVRLRLSHKHRTVHNGVIELQ